MVDVWSARPEKNMIFYISVQFLFSKGEIALKYIVIFDKSQLASKAENKIQIKDSNN